MKSCFASSIALIRATKSVSTRFKVTIVYYDENNLLRNIGYHFLSPDANV